MLLHEAASRVGVTNRAVNFFEEKGLLSVKKDENGYRNYSEADVETLKRISVYRKLGIGVQDIKILLDGEGKDILKRVYEQKLKERELQDAELRALARFIEDGDADAANEQLDYQTVGKAIQSLLPGPWGAYFKSHFLPFLDIRIETEEQRDAWQNILDFCDTTTIRVPILMKLGGKVAGGISDEKRSAEEMIARYRDLSDSAYDKLKEQVRRGAKVKSGLMRYHPVFAAQRKMQKELQNKDYNDVFLPNMRALSPKYDEYAMALNALNERICGDLGLHYDANYNLVPRG